MEYVNLQFITPKKMHSVTYLQNTLFKKWGLKMCYKLVRLLLTSTERVVEMTRRALFTSNPSKVGSAYTGFVQGLWKASSVDCRKLDTITH